MLQYACHERPEPVLGMGIVLLGFKGGNTGHGAQNDMGAAMVNAGSKADAVRI